MIHDREFEMLFSSDVLYDIAEELKMKMPTTPNNIEMKDWLTQNSAWTFINKFDPFKLRNQETKDVCSYLHNAQ